MSILKTKKKTLFWLFQIIIWSVYFYYDLQFIYPQVKTDVDFIIYLISLTYFGMPLSFLLSYVYKRIKRKWESIHILIISVVFSSVLLAHVWLAQIMLLDRFLAYRGHHVTSFTLHYYLWEIFTATILLVFWSALYLSFKFWEDWRSNLEISLKLKEIENQKVEAELNALKSQLNPHFLFNVLNSIYSHSLLKSDLTPSIVLKLSDLMSYILYDCKTETVLLKKEIEFIRNYIDLEKIRLEKDIEVQVDIKNADQLWIAPLLFVPLIENAFKHGIGSNPEKKYIAIHIEYDRSEFHFTIMYTRAMGPGNAKKKNTSGIGIENVRKRLQLLYPNKHKMKLTENEDSFEVDIIITGLSKNNP